MSDSTRETPVRYVRRHVLQITQEELAAIGGVSRPRVSRYESGRENPPYPFMLRVRAEAKRRGLRFSGDWFFETPTDAEAA